MFDFETPSRPLKMSSLIDGMLLLRTQRNGSIWRTLELSVLNGELPSASTGKLGKRGCEPGNWVTFVPFEACLLKLPKVGVVAQWLSGSPQDPGFDPLAGQGER